MAFCPYVWPDHEPDRADSALLVDTCPYLSLDRDMPRARDPIPPQVSLRALREAVGLDSRQLAERIKEQGIQVHPDTLLNVELGRKRASDRLLIAWARALGIKKVHIRQADELREWLESELDRSAA